MIFQHDIWILNMALTSSRDMLASGNSHVSYMSVELEFGGREDFLEAAPRRVKDCLPSTQLDESPKVPARFDVSRSLAQGEYTEFR